MYNNNLYDEYEQQEIKSKFMSKVYLWMTLGLLLTGLCASVVSRSYNIIYFMYTSSLYIILPIIEVALVFFISRRIDKISSTTAITLFFVYSALNGITLSSLLLIYQGLTVGFVFVLCASMFGIMSLFGMTTKRDISNWRSGLFMCLIGILIASVFNIFMQSHILYYIVSYAGVVLFSLLTIYDTQKIMSYATYAQENEEAGKKLAIMGALSLYLDFINLFIYLLRIFGSRD